MEETTQETSTPMSLKELRQAFIQLSKNIWKSMRQPYVDVGMPYGESNEGYFQWLKELGEVKRHQDAIEDIIKKHALLKTIREREAAGEIVVIPEGALRFKMEKAGRVLFRKVKTSNEPTDGNQVSPLQEL